MDKQQKQKTAIELSKEDIQGQYENRESLQTLINQYCCGKTNDEEGQFINPHLRVALIKDEKVLGIKELNSLFNFLQKIIKENRDSYPLEISFFQDEQELGFTLKSPKMHYKYKK